MMTAKRINPSFRLTERRYAFMRITRSDCDVRGAQGACAGNVSQKSSHSRGGGNPEKNTLLTDSGSRIKSGMTPSFAEDLISIPPRAELRLHASGLPNTKHQCFNL